MSLPHQYYYYPKFLPSALLAMPHAVSLQFSDLMMLLAVHTGIVGFATARP
ncbi:hypothetical protein DFH07DRAFT_930607 [Mycena maculata]|uniref:Uncharacterized protein n=1 Tax=Mycena maculata TaxID=230809 RepID=A0AAD7MQ77_9AGAR|nr:hypothetical protein DFH07DRAFT_930607 [Mycena maculata]